MSPVERTLALSCGRVASKVILTYVLCGLVYIRITFLYFSVYLTTLLVSGIM
jgi:hypothetical protein